MKCHPKIRRNSTNCACSPAVRCDRRIASNFIEYHRIRKIRWNSTKYTVIQRNSTDCACSPAVRCDRRIASNFIEYHRIRKIRCDSTKYTVIQRNSTDCACTPAVRCDRRIASNFIEFHRIRKIRWNSIVTQRNTTIRCNSTKYNVYEFTTVNAISAAISAATIF